MTQIRGRRRTLHSRILPRAIAAISSLISLHSRVSRFFLPLHVHDNFSTSIAEFLYKAKSGAAECICFHMLCRTAPLFHMRSKVLFQICFILFTSFHMHCRAALWASGTMYFRECWIDSNVKRGLRARTQQYLA